MQPYVAPAFSVSAFNCPNCHAYANQTWFKSAICDMQLVQHRHELRGLVAGFHVAICSHCKKPSYWMNDQMIYPNVLTAPFPNDDLPVEIKADFEEARQISNLSPKGAAALLRLVIQKICIHLEQPGKDLNTDIGNLVKKGLSPKIQMALDVVRVIGNESVHPGQIDLNDDPAVTAKLFELVNIIADTMISHPKEIEKLYGSLPEGKKAAIEKRDGQ